VYINDSNKNMLTSPKNQSSKRQSSIFSFSIFTSKAGGVLKDNC